jgi:hypothetical protein
LLAGLILSLLFFSAFPTTQTFGQLKNIFDEKVDKIKALNPTEISSVYDGKGGVYIFWKESRSKMESKIYFTHSNLMDESYGTILGTNISDISFFQSSPFSIPYLLGDIVLAWKDYSNQLSGDLYLQRISKNDLLWNRTGIRINNSPEQIIKYSLSADDAGNIFVAYTAREEYPSSDFQVKYQRLLSDGSLSYKNSSLIIESSPRLKNNLKIINDDKGGAFILWTEKLNETEGLLLKKVDASGKSVLGKRPIRISGALHDVVALSTATINNSLIYIAWETSDKNIYHQLINREGKAIWTIGGVKAALTNGKNFSPKIFSSGAEVTIGWLNEYRRTNNLFVQKYKSNGKALWKKNGVIAASVNSVITNFSICDDLNGGVTTAWIWDSAEKNNCYIGIQKINSKAKLEGDTLQIPSSIELDCENKYLSVYALSEENMTLAFQNKTGEIFISKVLSHHLPPNNFVELRTELIGKYIKLKISTNIREENYSLIVERQTPTDSLGITWKYIGSINSTITDNISEYALEDLPSTYGTLYYRTILKSNSKELISNIARIDYMEEAARIVVAQNNPNPFRDSTIINFYLPAATTVSFEFFDEHIEKIGETEERLYPAGENSITFYGNGFNPGIYFYKFVSKDLVEVKKMVID